METVNLYIININEARKYYGKMYAQIAKYRQDRADSYYHEDDKLRSVCAAYLVKKYVKTENLKYNDYGKPKADNGLYFNISHSGNFVVLATSEYYDVGVDVEGIKKKDMSFLENIFAPGELDKATLEESYLLWCNKESLSKCIGSGLANIKEAPAKPINGHKKFEGTDYYSVSFSYMKYAFSVTIKGKESFKVNKKIVKVAKDFAK